MNVLSLFDGISCARVALQRAKIKVDNYYASEIDPNAMKISRSNYRDIIQLGDVSKIKDPPSYDLLIAGSPCQGFSRAGEQLNFSDPRSKLFFEFIRLLNKDKLFILENVPGPHEKTITEILGVAPIRLNSSLVSAQSRQRLYWTNIEVKRLPDKRIVINDILVKGRPDGTYTRKIPYPPINPYTPNAIGMANEINGHDILKRIYSTKGKAPTLVTASGGNREPKIALSKTHWRKLTPLECERLQTLPEGYTNYVPKTHRYNTLGNGITVDVLAHILFSIC